MQKWEYVSATLRKSSHEEKAGIFSKQTVSGWAVNDGTSVSSLDNILGDYGESGWELVSLVAASGYSYEAGRYLVVFKRPKA